MAATFRPGRPMFGNSSGLVRKVAKVKFYDPGTADVQVVYSDDGLTTPRSQPVSTDSYGALPVIYMVTGTYRVQYLDSSDNVLYDDDDQDTGAPASAASDILAGVTTAAGARTAIAAASQEEVDDLGTAIASVQSGLDGLPGGALGTLAGLDEITRDELATGFGTIVLQAVSLDTEATVVTCNSSIPMDDSIPQSGEGVEVLSGSVTPKSSSSVLEIEYAIQGTQSGGTNRTVIAALFQDSGANALAAGWNDGHVDNSGNGLCRIVHTHRMNSPGTSSVTFKVRVGTTGGSGDPFYVNGNGSGTRRLGGISVAYLRVKEYLAV